MRLHEHRDHIVFGESVLIVPLLSPVLVLLFIFGLQFFCAAAVVAREPADIWVEIAHIAQQLSNRVLVHFWKLFGLSIFVEFDNSDDGHIVEIENAIDLDPLQTDSMVIAGMSGDQLAPDVLGYEVILVLF